MIGSIREALKAGCKLAITEIKITMREMIRTSPGAMVAERTSPCLHAKIKGDADAIEDQDDDDSQNVPGYSAHRSEAKSFH